MEEVDAEVRERMARPAARTLRTLPHVWKRPLDLRTESELRLPRRGTRCVGTQWRDAVRRRSLRQWKHYLPRAVSLSVLRQARMERRANFVLGRCLALACR